MKPIIGCSLLLTCLLFFSSAFAQPDTLWSNTFNIDLWDASESVLKTSDGYIITGYCHDALFNYDVMTLKVDLSGSLMWTNRYSDPTLEFESSYEILEAPGDNEFYIFGSAQRIGTSYSDIRILRIDGDGNLLDEKFFGGEYEDWVRCAAQTSDGGYIIAGSEGIYPAMDVFLLKTDPQLNVEWRNSYGGTGYDSPSSVIQTSDGGFLVTGTTKSFGAQGNDCYLLKTDPDGTVEIETIYGSPLFDRMVDVCETDDGLYTGLWMKYNPSSTTIVKLDTQGTILWENEHMMGIAAQMLLNNDGTIVITGVYIHDMWLMCADALGNELWETRLNAGTLNHCGYAMCATDADGYLVAAGKNLAAGETDIWLLNFDSYSGIEWENPQTEGLLVSSIWPNPSTGPVFVEYNMPVQSTALITIYDATGRTVHSSEQGSLPGGSHTFCWTPDEEMPQGCYSILIEACGSTVSQRCVILR